MRGERQLSARPADANLLMFYFRAFSERQQSPHTCFADIWFGLGVNMSREGSCNYFEIQQLARRW
jgi:hypothetical protein